jgi:glycosyltransferase involved in cell wall biosynthesis
MISIYILCYNEAIIIAQTIHHYRSVFPSCKITILDNESEDASVEIAKSLGCFVETFSTHAIMNEFVQTELKNNIWLKNYDRNDNNKNDWVIVCDMDEWLFITESELLDEERKGTTILTTAGYNMVGESEKADLSDITISSITKGYFTDRESKKICFNRRFIDKMNFDYGAHNCRPEGSSIIYSSKVYPLRHYHCLGFVYLAEKQLQRAKRAQYLAEKYGMNKHYKSTLESVYQLFKEEVKKADVIL